MANEQQPVEESTFKSMYTSKTFWVNIIAIVALFAQSKFGYIIDENTQMQILAVVNIGLRSITKEPVVWKKSKKTPDQTPPTE